MRVIMCQPQFHQAILDGIKTTTIRKAARCVPGDALSLRSWSGKPYRSKHLILAESTCKSIRSIAIYANRQKPLIRIDGEEQGSSVLDKIAQADGFPNVKALVDWFAATYSLPFYGEIIAWNDLCVKESL